MAFIYRESPSCSFERHYLCQAPFPLDPLLPNMLYVVATFIFKVIFLLVILNNSLWLIKFNTKSLLDMFTALFYPPL